MTSHGRPLWYTLALPADAGAAASFYADVVGWQVSSDLGRTLLCVDGRALAEVRVGASTPRWLTCFGVDDLDAAVAQAVGLGATVLTSPAQGDGVEAALRDPTGAELVLLQPDTPPMEPRDEAGFITWIEHASADHPAAWDFYAALFGWRLKANQDIGHMGEYRLFATPASDNAGGMYTVPPGMPIPPSWLPYATVPDLEAGLARATAAGATVVNGPLDVGGGDRIAVFIDPMGASFALHAAGQR